MDPGLVLILSFGFLIGSLVTITCPPVMWWLEARPTPEARVVAGIFVGAAWPLVIAYGVIRGTWWLVTHVVPAVRRLPAYVHFFATGARDLLGIPRPIDLPRATIVQKEEHK